ncbi:MAG: hypothetical protein A2Y40_10690 [Candidatus Margulisbacteria bacterium GWF2_35_9]|nr:MAG: hypothetical protein A2Y40_10690 [Candidatus Margulisbacteria bacterium GWF2_35_9]
MNIQRINTILIIGVIMFSILTVFQQGKHYNLDYKMQALKNELKTIENENQEMQLKYNMKYDLKWVYDYATVTLNMIFPNEIKSIYE